MPEQFPYPEQGWSTGTMRKAKKAPPSDPGYPIRELEGEKKKRETKVSQAEAKHPELSEEEWKNFWQGNWNVVGEAGRVDPSKADPGGFIIKKGHPQIKELEEGGWESMSIPSIVPGAGEAWTKDYQFIRPKQREPLVS